MMKIALCSDLHLEMGHLELSNTQNAELLILSGDICTAIDLKQTGEKFPSYRQERYLEFFTECAIRFPHVIYVMGNHEHYHGDYADSVNILKHTLNDVSKLNNIHILEKEVFDLGEHRFIGGTLWTDMNGGDWATMKYVSRCMNDFKICRNSAHKVNYNINAPTFDKNGAQKKSAKGTLVYHQVSKTRDAWLTPEDVIVDHKAMLKLIDETYTATPLDKTIVVVGHHAPSKSSEHARFKDDPMNGGFNSSLDDFITSHPRIKMWTHGHTHDEYDYMLGQTRVICNPRGYINHERRADLFELKFLEI